MSEIELKARELLAAQCEADGMPEAAKTVRTGSFEGDAADGFRTTIRALVAALSPQWQPIESAPKDGTEVDLWHPKLGRITGSNWDSYMERWTILCDSEGPTHFMLPPAQPEVEG